jgi:hypothetical protein
LPSYKKTGIQPDNDGHRLASGRRESALFFGAAS